MFRGASGLEVFEEGLGDWGSEFRVDRFKVEGLLSKLESWKRKSSTSTKKPELCTLHPSLEDEAMIGNNYFPLNPKPSTLNPKP